MVGTGTVGAYRFCAQDLEYKSMPGPPNFWARIVRAFRYQPRLEAMSAEAIGPSCRNDGLALSIKLDGAFWCNAAMRAAIDFSISSWMVLLVLFVYALCTTWPGMIVVAGGMRDPITEAEQIKRAVLCCKVDDNSRPESRGYHVLDVDLPFLEVACSYVSEGEWGVLRLPR